MRRLALAVLAVPALLVLAAPPASAAPPAAGCTTTYVEDVTTMQAQPFVEVNGLDVTVYGSRVVAIPLNVAGATLAYVDCVA